MYLALKKTARLHREEPCVVVFSAEEGGKFRYVHPVFAVLLALCDGQRTREELLQVLAEVFAMAPDRAEETAGRLISDFSDLLDTHEEPSPFEARYDPAEFIYQPQGDPRLRRVSTPLFIAWLVTERCPFDCAYCCIPTLPPSPPPRNEMTTAQALAFLQDCVETGVAAVTFHGGEPFLRKDLPDLVGHLVAAGVHVATSTKLRLPESTVARLAAAGLEELQVSIDAVEAAIADSVVGRPGFLAGALHNLEILQHHGIRPKVNTVVTARNLSEIPAVIRTVYERGVRKVTLSGYLRSFWKHDDALLPDPEELRVLDGEVSRLAETLPGLEVTMCPLEDPRDSSLAKEGFAACSGGTSGLVVGADGRVSICDRLLGFDDAVVGDVTRSSLREVWEGDALLRLVDPPSESFAGTACESCRLAPTCDRRVRCYYRSKMINGCLFGPDYLCPRMPAPPIRFF